MMPKDVTVMGDPHLGRKFKTGVPLHRVGERERLVWTQFADELYQCSTPFHINMGDLFDSFVVAPEVVLAAVRVYKKAAKMNPDTTYVVIEGNHDRAKDSSKASSFDLFANLVVSVPNIMVVQETAAQVGDYAVVPFHPFRHAADLVNEITFKPKVIFGHWDIQDWGGDNVIPTKMMAKMGIKLAISGHDHVARTEKRDGVDIIVTGSMQPYTHAEDKTGEWYITTSLPIEGDVTHKNVRVLLKKGETLPEDLDCLSLTAKRVTDEEEKTEVDTSDWDSLDLKDLLARELEGLSIKDTLMEEFNHA